MDTSPPSPDPASAQIATLYKELRAIARSRMDRLPPQTVGATDVVHEAVARLLRGDGLRTGMSDDHLLALAAQAIRGVVVDRARARYSQRRGGGRRGLDIDEHDPGDTRDEDVLGVHDALDALGRVDPRAAEVVTLRFFGGLSEVEAAGALGVTDRTVRRDWRFARAWLLREVGVGPD